MGCFPVLYHLTMHIYNMMGMFFWRIAFKGLPGCIRFWFIDMGPGALWVTLTSTWLRNHEYKIRNCWNYFLSTWLFIVAVHKPTDQAVWMLWFQQNVLCLLFHLFYLSKPSLLKNWLEIPFWSVQSEWDIW